MQPVARRLYYPATGMPSQGATCQECGGSCYPYAIKRFTGVTTKVICPICDFGGKK